MTKCTNIPLVLMAILLLPKTVTANPIPILEQLAPESIEYLYEVDFTEVLGPLGLFAIGLLGVGLAARRRHATCV